MIPRSSASSMLSNSAAVNPSDRACAAARSLGFTAALFDSMLEADERGIIPQLDRHVPGIVVIYDDDFNYLTKMCLSRMREAAYTMSRIARDRGCTVIVHG